MVHSIDQLTDKERQILRLLAEGHTVKTIAVAHSLSVNVVNDRLRAARRRTGASSSRELARVMIANRGDEAQINQDKFLGVAAPVRPDHDLGHAFSKTTGGDLPWKGSIVISSLVAAITMAVYTSVPVPAAQLEDGIKQWAIIEANQREGWVLAVDSRSIQRRGSQATFSQADLVRKSDGSWGSTTSTKTIACDRTSLGDTRIPYGRAPQQRAARFVCEGDMFDVAGPFSSEITLGDLVQMHSPE